MLPASLLQMDEDYDDFSEVPKLLRYAYNLPVRDDKIVDLLLPPKKRHRKNIFLFINIVDGNFTCEMIANDEGLVSVRNDFYGYSGLQ